MATEKRQLKTAMEETATGKIGLPEKSATKNKRVGKQVGKHKINVCNNGNEKRQRKKPQGKKMGNRELGNGKIRQRQ